MWSLTMAPIALMAALRETSVFFATAIAAIFMKDRIGPLHWLAALLALAGVVTIRLA
jgi:drug/metabolite transporter (DMT)-like permease